VISRVRRHRARRRRFDPNASLEFDFQAQPPLTIAPGPASSWLPVTCGEDAPVRPDQQDGQVHVEDWAASFSTPKIIRFPGPVQAEKEIKRTLARAVGQEDGPAPPATNPPRILDAQDPQQIELIPSFADICLDEPPGENSLADEFDLPAQPAALGRRLGSGLIDTVIVLAALLVFSVGVLGGLSLLSEAVPRSRPVLLCAVATGAVLWLVFQYLFLVYGKGTPGMGVAGLELLTFDGLRPSLVACRRRAMATTLSVVSLGLGFAWALVDEDTLGWHDRISATYLKSSH
jgi:uncharacterized RDD family membrane protein YckC